jgi:hypothetical protein
MLISRISGPSASYGMSTFRGTDSPTSLTDRSSVNTLFEAFSENGMIVGYQDIGRGSVRFWAAAG